jgi:hypothetical protein
MAEHPRERLRLDVLELLAEEFQPLVEVPLNIPSPAIEGIEQQLLHKWKQVVTGPL